MKNSDSKIQEIQFLEQNLQNLLMQKQAFQMELSETQAALKELENSGEEVFKIVGQLMIKSDKGKMQKELAEKEKIINLRTTTIEKQENSLSEKLTSLRDEIMKSMKK
ncbi:MAG: prefoldin subunit beta [Nanoarchaeota archaeon]|nr:prefoldin subunit beta [Nanoarchaeota archaeon]MBU4116959.1 prefoldin subunit beta [Nanoarchaeota archaeon]